MRDQAEIEATINLLMKASYGKILARLCARSGDLQACEDAISHAFSSAFEHWREGEIPETPEAWVFKAAKNKLVDSKRRDQRFMNLEAGIAQMTEELAEQDFEGFQDQRMKLLFMCAHPSIDEAVRTPLMLQTVLGLEASQIASAFLTSPEAMSKKLVRAKQKIKLAGIEFVVPDGEHLFERTEYVAEAIYAIYGKSWDALGSPAATSSDLDQEAIFLAELLVQLLPDQPEAKGLLAYILFCESRKVARQTEVGEYVPLDEQNPKLWNNGSIARADQLLQQAFQLARIGRFQIEAAIQSAHTARILFGINNWGAILGLYDGLISHTPTVGSVVGRASALSRVRNPEDGLKALDEIPTDLIRSYQPYWALKASLHSELGQTALALSSYESAIGLCQNESVRNFLIEKRERVG